MAVVLLMVCYRYWRPGWGRPCVSRPDVLGGTVADVSALLHSCWSGVSPRYNMIVFFSHSFVLVRREPGTLRWVSIFNSTKVGSGAEKDLTLGAADVHAVRESWGGRLSEVDGGALLGTRVHWLNPLKRKRSLSQWEKHGGKKHTLSIQWETTPIQSVRTSSPPLKTSHWLSSGDSKHFVHLSWKRCSAAGVTDFNLHFLVVPTRPSVVPLGIVVPVFLDEMMTPALITHRLNATDCDRVSSRRCFLCLFVWVFFLLFLFSLVKKYKYPQQFAMY